MAVDALYDRILVPTDGSDAADAAIEHAVSIATANEAAIHAVYVIDSRITMAARDETRAELREDLEAEGRAAVDRILEQAAAAGVDGEAVIRQGTPSKELLEYAEAADVDLVVMGSEGKSPREKLIGMGSVSERVVDKTTVPVMVVPSPDAAG